MKKISENNAIRIINIRKKLWKLKFYRYARLF